MDGSNNISIKLCHFFFSFFLFPNATTKSGYGWLNQHLYETLPLFLYVFVCLLFFSPMQQQNQAMDGSNNISIKLCHCFCMCLFVCFSFPRCNNKIKLWMAQTSLQNFASKKKKKLSSAATYLSYRWSNSLSTKLCHSLFQGNKKSKQQTSQTSTLWISHQYLYIIYH